MSDRLDDRADRMTSRRAVRKSLSTNFEPGPRHYLDRARLRFRQAVHLPGLWLGGQLTRPIFIIGAPRSGTSLLYSVLRTHPDLSHWPGEAHEVWEADFHPALTGWDSNVIKSVRERPEAAHRIARSFYLVAGRKRLIDKTPRNALRVAFIQSLFPDASFIFLTRDGRDNVNSLINAWRTPRYRTYRMPEPLRIPGVDPSWWKFTLYPGWRDDVAGPLEVVCARQWRMSYDYALAELPDDERRVTVRYEDYIESAEKETGRILDALGLDFAPAVREKARATSTTPINVVTPPERGKWRKENPDEIAAVLPLIAPTMAALGYSLR